MRIKLSEVCDIQYGFPFDSAKFSESEGTPLIRIRDVKRGYTETYTVEDVPDEYIIAEGEILIGMDGEFNVAKWGKTPAALNQRVCHIIPKDGIDSDYIFFALPSKLKEIENKTAFVTVKHLSAKALNAIEINVPSIDKQHTIAEILRHMVSIIETRKQQLSELDILIKARFVEMFGEPESNTKRWAEKKMSDLCTVSSSKRILQSEQCEEGIPFLRVSDLVRRMDTGELSADLHIPEARYADLCKQGQVPAAGDILVTSRGTLGRCYIWDAEDKFYFQDGMISWLSNYSNEVTPLYLSYLFSMPGFKKQIDRLQAGSTVAYLSIAMIKQLVVMLPDVELQEQFAAFVAQVDKSKIAIQKALDEAQILFDSLMQEFFG